MPTIPPEMFAGRMIMVYQADGKTPTAASGLDGTGRYAIDLPAGAYRVDFTLTGIEIAEGIPALIEIRGGESTTLDITVDTGLR